MSIEMLRERYNEKFKPNESFKLETSTPEESEDYDVSSADNANIDVTLSYMEQDV